MANLARRGFTLIELMVAAAVAIIAITAATATLVTQVTAQRNTEKRNAIGVQLALAEVVLDRKLANATLGFADPRFGFRLRNNNTSNLPNGDGTAVGAVNLGDAAAGVVSGTDVIEAVSGNSLTRRAGIVSKCGSPSCNNGLGTATAQLATTEPLTIGEATTLLTGATARGPLLLFTDEAGNSCLGRATSITPGITTSMNVNYLDADLNAATPTSTACPGVTMRVYGADTRRRYMIYQQANGTNLGIYTQDMDPSTLAYGAPTLLVAGIEDMQVQPSVATATPGQLQRCNDQPTAPTCTLSNTNDWQVRSADIRLTARGTQTLAEAGGRRQISFDHTAGTVDNIYRQYGQFSLLLVNASLVNL